MLRSRQRCRALALEEEEQGPSTSSSRGCSERQRRDNRERSDTEGLAKEKEKKTKPHKKPQPCCRQFDLPPGSVLSVPCVPCAGLREPGPAHVEGPPFPAAGENEVLDLSFSHSSQSVRPRERGRRRTDSLPLLTHRYLGHQAAGGASTNGTHPSATLSRVGGNLMGNQRLMGQTLSRARIPLPTRQWPVPGQKWPRQDTSSASNPVAPGAGTTDLLGSDLVPVLGVSQAGKPPRPGTMEHQPQGSLEPDGQKGLFHPRGWR